MLGKLLGAVTLVLWLVIGLCLIFTWSLNLFVNGRDVTLYWVLAIAVALPTSSQRVWNLHTPTCGIKMSSN